MTNIEGGTQVEEPLPQEPAPAVPPKIRSAQLTLDSLGKFWDATVTRVTAAAGLAIFIVYFDGAAVVAGRLLRRAIPFTAVIGQFPKQFLLTVGLEEVLLPTCFVMSIAWLFARQLFFARDWVPTRLDGKGYGYAWRVGLALALGAIFSCAASGVSAYYGLFEHYSFIRQLVVNAVSLAMLIFLCLEARTRLIGSLQNSRSNDEVKVRSLYAGATTLPIIMLLLISVGSAIPFPLTQMCGPRYPALSVGLITVSSDTIYAIQYSTLHNNEIDGQLLIVPRTSVDFMNVGDTGCPSASS